MEAFQTLKNHSHRLRTLEMQFGDALQEIRMLRNQLEVVIVEVEKLLPEPVPSQRSESPLLLQPLAPAPRHKRSRACLTKVRSFSIAAYRKLMVNPRKMFRSCHNLST